MPKLGWAAGLGLVLVGLVGYLLWPATEPGGAMDSGNPTLVARGEEVYRAHCASCHGRDLEGQPDWRVRKPDGRLPAPPHDESGHTWHHAAGQLFALTKQGLEPFAPAGYESDMPAFAETLSDPDIWAVLSYIGSRWPEEIQRRHERIGAAQE